MPPLPDALRTPPPALAPLLAAWTRALRRPRERGAARPRRSRGCSPRRSRAEPASRGPTRGLRALLQRRIESLHGEFRTLAGPFSLAELGEDPGVARIAPGRRLARARAHRERARRAARARPCAATGRRRPRWLDGPAPVAREIRVHARALREAVPEPLARRAVLAGAASGCGSADWPITLLQEPSTRGPQFVELVAGATFPADHDASAAEDAIAAGLGGLLPFAGNRVRRANSVPRPLWDDDSARFAALPGSWPHGLELRASRRHVYRLAREHVAALGAEGEILLGVRAGDAILADLS